MENESFVLVYELTYTRVYIVKVCQRKEINGRDEWSNKPQPTLATMLEFPLLLIDWSSYDGLL